MNMKWLRIVIYRFKQKTPPFFKAVFKVCIGISSVALAIQTALSTSGAIIPDWWQFIYPYLIGVPAGMAGIAKLTIE
jgi:hypothetical protein